MLTLSEKRYMRTVGDHIKKVRSEKGMTQYVLFIRSGIPQNTISNYETGRRNPTLLRLYRLSSALGCSVRDLLP